MHVLLFLNSDNSGLITAIATCVLAVATCLLAVAAWRGIDTWKKQKRTNIRWDFLDELICNVNEYINLMGTPIKCLKFIGIQLKSYENNKIDYLKKCGKQDGLKLQEYLDKASSIDVKINSLAVKGQVLGFSKYSECLNACHMLNSVFQQFTGISSLLIMSECAYWGNPEVIKCYDGILELPENAQSIMEERLKEHSIKLLNFAQENFYQLFRA